MGSNQFFRELCTTLRREGSTAQPERDGLLPVEWMVLPLCKISDGASIRYAHKDVDTLERERACQKATDLACVVRKYMTLIEQAPPLKAQGPTGDFRTLSEFNGTVLAGHQTEYGVHLVTWDWSFDRKGLNQGHSYRETAWTPSGILPSAPASFPTNCFSVRSSLTTYEDIWRRVIWKGVGL